MLATMRPVRAPSIPHIAMAVPCVGLVLAVAALAPTASSAAGSFCTSYAKHHKLKRVFADGGVVALGTKRSMTICMPHGKRTFGLAAGEGGTATALKAVDGKCVALAAKVPKGLPLLVTVDVATDVKGHQTAYSQTTIGFGSPAATIESLVLSSTCVAAVGADVTAADATVSRLVSTSQVLADGRSNTFPMSPATTATEVRHIKIAASGKGATVSWTEGGVPKSQTVTPTS
jgi:hypothetical protein